MLKSRLHWGLIVSAIIGLTIGLFIYEGSIQMLLNENTNNSGLFNFIACLVVGSIEIASIVKVIAFTKLITILDERLILRYLFTRRKFEYSISELKGFHRTKHYNKYGNYRSIEILTPDNKLLIFYSYEFSNYAQITNAIAANSRSIVIDRWPYWRTVIKIIVGSFSASLVLLFFIILISGR